MSPSSMTCRQFTFLGVSALLASPIPMAPSGLTSDSLPMTRVVRLPDGRTTLALGMGSWRLAQGRCPVVQEEEAMRLRISLGMTLIDTADMYGNVVSEQMIGRGIAGRRAGVFLASKVRPSNATTASFVEACARSLRNLGTDYLDLYLLHRRGQVRNLGLVVDTFEALKIDHVCESARAMSISLDAQYLAQLNKALPV